MTFEQRLTTLLERVRSGALPPEAAMEELRFLPFSDLGFAHVDHHRELRQGLAEVVYCEGKTTAQVLAITGSLLENNHGSILLTRASDTLYDSVAKLEPSAEWHEQARMITVSRNMRCPYGLVSVISAGTSDIPVAEEARVTAGLLGSRVEPIYDVGVAGAHRLFAHEETLRRSTALVVVAGMEGALASLVGGIARCPVIAVPTSVGYGASFGGLAALLAMMNSCAPGVSVVNIDNGFGAGYIAGSINRMVNGGAP